MQIVRLKAGTLAVAWLTGGLLLGCGGQPPPSGGSVAKEKPSTAEAPAAPTTIASQPAGSSEAEKARQAEAARLLSEKRLAEEKIQASREPDGSKFGVKSIDISAPPVVAPSPPSEPPSPADIVKPKKHVVKKAAKRSPPDVPSPNEPDQANQPKETKSPSQPPVDAGETTSTVVKVFYATDRAPVDAAQWLRSLRGGWPGWTGILAVATVALWAWSRRRPRRLVRWLAWCGLAGAVLLGGLTLVYQLQPEPIRPEIGRMYGNQRGDLEFGTCEVSIPRDHQVGEMESPSVLRLEFHEDPERHVVLHAVHAESADEFHADLKSCVGRSSDREAFVFVHGFNVGFETAARRTAQIAYDLKFDGAPIFYSWPSQEGLLAYTVDETNVAWTVPHLKEFLVAVASRSGARSMHLVAHSMGNRALTSALRELAMEMKADCPKFHEVVLTAPDIDADVFRRDLAPAIARVANRVTLYASSNDEALIASKAIHGYRRAGDSGHDILIVPGIDTVDVSDVDTSFIGHCYYGSNRTVLADLFELLGPEKPPSQRKSLRSARLGQLPYWVFVR